jgi:hypothetical protein
VEKLSFQMTRGHDGLLFAHVACRKCPVLKVHVRSDAYHVQNLEAARRLG